MTDFTQYITSRHVRRPKYMAMVALVTGIYDAQNQVAQSLSSAYDIDNAIGAQLDAIGEWVGRPRVVEDVLSPEFFGFADDIAAQPFGELVNVAIGGRFHEQGESFSSSSVLGDPEYRTILKAKIVRNQWNGTTAGLEQALQYVFGVPCTVVDGGTFSLNIQVGRPITAVEKTLLATFDLLPRPAGVQIATVQYVQFIAGAAVSASIATGHL